MSDQQYVSPLISSFPDIIGMQLPCKYRPRRPIGRGAYSTVWSLINNETGDTVVGKLADLSQMSEDNQNFARSEAQNIRQLDHPNIIKLFDTYERDHKLLHVLEYADAGDLLTQVEVRTRSKGAEGGPAYYQQDELLVILSQLCLAIEYIHDRRIMHRDLKTPNVMLMKVGLIKLGDFGFSRKYDESVSNNVGNTFCGTPYYLAPELWRQQPYSYKADIWSLGVMCYELMTLGKPFPAADLDGLMQRVCQQGSYEPLPADRYSADLIQLVERMLTVNPDQRPSIKEVLHHPVVSGRGLELIKINVRRLRNLEVSVADRIVAEVDRVQAEVRAASQK
ncbi:protein kinase [Angomonas deanei]|uniref:non-specific serine/threonine protein kinase n=1 Tax=Angomonas deanei TaxID=59799 RepID=S9WUL8_9TRYP|nr:protein kinase [Angomonas deanei]EPY39785.1 protein kinase [Angomonas deanei]CAD2218413.1 Protein kinase domain/Protein tyrosine kinase/Kinase-like, putative [Angomonas deanei]|eukprot:EPY28776.1 protein kinase [Angomonas deanei]